MLSSGSSPFTSPSTTGTRCEPVTRVLGANRRTSTSWLGEVPPPIAKPASVVVPPLSTRRPRWTRAWRPSRCRTRRGRPRPPTRAGTPAGDDAHAGRVAARRPEPRRSRRSNRSVRRSALGGRQCGHERLGMRPSGSVASRRGRLARLRGQRAARRGARRRLLAARGAAGPPRHPLAQGRLQPAGPVRLLHGAGRRPAAGGLRDAGPAGRRPAGDDRRGLRRTPVAGPTRSRAAGASQCGFCTPGIIVRLAGAGAWTADRGRGRPGAARPPLPLHRLADDPGGGPRDGGGTRPAPTGRRSADDAARRATLEGRAPQRRRRRGRRSGGAASPTTPRRSTRSSRCGRPTATWVVGETLTEARAAAGKVQGRRTTVAAALADRAAGRASGPARCARRGSSPATWRPTRRGACPAASRRRRWPTAARSAARSPARSAARRPPAGRRARPRRSASCSRGRTPCARVRSDRRSPPGCGPTARGVVRVARTPGIAGRHRRGGARAARWRRSTWPARRPRPRSGPRAGRRRPCCWPRWATGPDTVRSPDGAEATAAIDARRSRRGVASAAGAPLDAVVLRSYCIGAAHMALGWVRSEGIAVDDAGRAARPHDPLVRHPAGGRHAADRGDDRGGRRRARQRLRRGVRRGRRRRPGGRCGFPERWPAR